MKLVSWNVNGFRAVLGKGFDEAFIAQNADIFCLQETKMKEGQAAYDPPGYSVFCIPRSAPAIRARRCSPKSCPGG